MGGLTVRKISYAVANVVDGQLAFISLIVQYWGGRFVVGLWMGLIHCVFGSAFLWRVADSFPIVVCGQRTG